MKTPIPTLFALLLFASVHAQDPNDTKLLAEPAVSARHLAFVYGEDLWVSELDGSRARRLTTHVGRELNPRFSPDGLQIAFSAQYDGNVDVYLMPVAGGAPRRLTWHPSADVVQDFAPDGQRVLFASGRNVYTNRHRKLYEVSIDGGHPVELPIPHAADAAYSPDGAKIAYTPLGPAFTQWKNYRGGRTSRIWLYDRVDQSVVQVPQPAGRCNDAGPMWVGDRVYFRSDRDGEFNLFSFDPAQGTVARLTDYSVFPILSASAGAGRIAFEQAGAVHLFDPASAEATPLRISVATEALEARPRYVTGAEWVRAASISPSGARAVVEFRGEIVTVPKKKGDPRNLTNTPGVHERSPVWSPDGSEIAYASDAGGEYRLHVVSQDGRGEEREYELSGAGFYDSFVWSPDGTKLSYTDNSWSLYILDLETHACERVASEPIYGPVKTLSASWSPDSRWLAYTTTTETYFRRVHLYSLDTRRSQPITDGLTDVGEPVFDAGGEYLYFAASTDAGPVRQWFAMSNADMEMSSDLYLAVLKKGTPSPLLRESDEEEVEGDDEGPDVAEAAADKPGAKRGKEPPRVAVDFEGIERRIVAIPVGAGGIRNLRAGTPGQLYYLRSEGGARRSRGGPAGASLYRFDLEDRKESEIASGVSAFEVTPDGKHLIVRAGRNVSIVDAKPKADVAGGKIGIDAIRVRIDPRAEWRQIFDEAWRINRDWFYDPNMHGADWTAMRRKYEPFLRHLVTRSDLNRVIQWMCSELSVGHHRVGGGDRPYDVESVGVGLLGADFEVDSGRYRLAKVYGGLNWNRGMRSPLTEPGVDAEAGEYLLAVDGIDLRSPENLYSRFEDKVGKNVEITLGPNADGSDARTVTVVPIANESALRNRDWVEGNIRRVDEATGGRVAYVYVPNTAGSGHAYFKRYFFPQANKQAIIVDERHNGGGQIADYYVDLLSRQVTSWWTTRYGKDFKGPLSSIQGPKVMLIDETAGSGGDLLPYMFRRMKLGPLVGRRTWGGLVGTLGFPQLMDGGRVTAPNLAFWDETGFRVENEGVAPDVEVEQWPAEVIAGHDPQLEKAIEIVLEQLDANPPDSPERPPFPIRVRR